jgi:enoyl-CoA hydratase/carnithine racemase
MSTVNFSTDDGLGTITLDNPPLNLLTEEMIDDFETAVTQASRAPVRALMLRAEGPHFMAGADMAMFKGRSADQARALFARAIPAALRLEELPVPTVVAVQGYCVTAGLELALLADIAVAGESARFAQAERRIGTTTLLGGGQRLVERAGPARARQIIYDGDEYTAQQFADWNIVNHVVPDDEVLQRARSLAQHYAEGPTRALAAGKALVRAALDGGTRNADRLILNVAPALFETRDMQAGVDTLLEKGRRKFAEGVQFDGR